MNERKKASDLMIPLDSYPHVPYWFTLRQVTAIMEKAQSSDRPGRPVGARFVLVFDEAYSLLGIVRRRDLLRGLGVDAIESGGTAQTAVGSLSLSEQGASWDGVIGQIRKQAERPISEVMRPIHATVDLEDELLKVISTMVEQNVSMLPVLREGVVVGVIRSAEVFQQIASLIL